MKNKIFLTVIIIVALIISIILLMNFSDESPEGSEDNVIIDITIGMGYIPNVQFAPFYVAEAKGYYDEVNIKPQFDYAMSPDLLKLLGQKELDFVIATGDEVILATDKQIPVSYVMTLYSKLPIAIVSLEDNAITSLDDLKGKNIGLPGFYGSSYIGLEALLKKAEISESDINLESIGYTQVQAVSEKTVDGAVVFSMNEPLQLQKLGHTISTLELSEYLDFASAGVVTNNETISNDPELVASFVNATWRGMEYIVAHPEESFTLVKDFVDMDEDQQEVQYQILLKSIEFWYNQEAQLTNKIDPEIWESTVQILTEAELIQPNYDATTSYDSSFTQ